VLKLFCPVIWAESSKLAYLYAPLIEWEKINTSW
jgi:hypothetical protein